MIFHVDSNGSISLRFVCPSALLNCPYIVGCSHLSYFQQRYQYAIDFTGNQNDDQSYFLTFNTQSPGYLLYLYQTIYAPKTFSKVLTSYAFDFDDACTVTLQYRCFTNLLFLTSFPLQMYKIYRHQQHLYLLYYRLIDIVNILNHSLPIFTIQSDYEMNTKNGAYQPNNLQSPSLNALSDLDMNNFYCMNNNLPQYIFQLQLFYIPLTRILFLDPLTIAIEFVSSPPFLNS